MTTAIFDLDGTLTKKDTYLPFLFSCMKEVGLRIGPASLIPFLSVLYCFGIITNARLKEAFLRSVLSGVTLERLKPIVEKYVAALMEICLNQPLVEIVQKHLKRGDRVILVTASFDLYVETVAERLGISDVVCTRAEVLGGIVTGRLCGENCYGPEKVKRLETLLGPVDWRSAIFYTDHYSDLPLLKKVSRAYLVNPGHKTRALLKGYGFAPFRPNDITFRS
jgi:phosphatidylglycerophosphatase C